MEKTINREELVEEIKKKAIALGFTDKGELEAICALCLEVERDTRAQIMKWIYDVAGEIANM